MIGAYIKAPPWAWSGWRLRIPGEPDGGQYHGFIAPDSLGWRGVPGGPPPADQPAPWDEVWGGTPLGEGQSMSDYVVRGPAEMRPRANASGGTNVVHAFQTRRTAGYAEAPGNYRGVGALPPLYCSDAMRFCVEGETPVPGPCGTSCIPGPVIYGTGATTVVNQPPPGSPGSGNLTPWTRPPISPAPAPTVSATPTPASSPVTNWLSQSTIIPGVENLWIAGAVAAAAAYFAFRGHK